MSSGYVFPEEVIRETAPSRLDRILKWSIVVVILIFAAELIWLLGVRPCLPFSSVEVAGVPELDRGLILIQAGIDGRSSYVSLRPREAERALEELPQIGSARVMRVFPNRLRILLEDRRPVAVSLTSLEGRLLPVLFDKHGVIFKVGKTADLEGLLMDMPVISGLVFENAAVGMRLPPMFGPFFAGLEHLHDTAPELLAVLSEIRINRKAYDGFDLILYPSHNPVRVRVSELNEDMLRYMMLVIDVFSSKDVPVEELDFRTSTASYTVKEASSG